MAASSEARPSPSPLPEPSLQVADHDQSVSLLVLTAPRGQFDAIHERPADDASTEVPYPEALLLPAPTAHVAV